MAKAKAQYLKRGVPRLHDLIKEMRGDSQVQRETGVNRTTVLGWMKAKPSPPNLLRLIQLTQDSDVSIDWIAGFDLPMRRSDRTQVGAVRAAARLELIKVVARELQASEAFVAATLHEGIDVIEAASRSLQPMVEDRLRKRKLLQMLRAQGVRGRRTEDKEWRYLEEEVGLLPDP